MSQSNNILLVLLRKYLDFTSYWVTLFVVLANTGVMMVLAKHLWRAWWIKEGEKKPAMGPNKKSADGHSNSSKEKEPGCVSIDMGEEAAAAIQNCIDDSFLVEVILAAFDFFRVSETKQD